MDSEPTNEQIQGVMELFGISDPIEAIAVLKIAERKLEQLEQKDAVSK